MRKHAEEPSRSSPVLHTPPGYPHVSAANPPPQTLVRPAAERDYGLLARVLQPPRFRLTFAGYTGVVQLLIIKVYSRRSSGLLLAAGDTLPVYSIREPVLERFRSISRGAHVECRLTLRDNEEIVDPENGELATVPNAGLCHSIQVVER
jgi:hypothetical protein